MNALWVFAIAIGAVAGDVGLGYHYKVPHTSYGVPTYQSSGTSGIYNSGLAGSSSSNNYNTQYAGSVGTASNYYTGQGSTQSGQSSSAQQSTGYLTGFQATGASSAGTGADSNYYQTSNYVQPSYQSSGDYSTLSQYQTSNEYQTSAVGKYQQYYNVIQQQPAQIFKHYYVHAAPEEPEIPKSPKPIVLPPAQKHYKIIFIKAPTAQAQAPPIVPVQPQNEEKTIVYVLVQKPEDAQNIVLPKVEQKPPSKPEVYFINYNNKHDSQAVINNIVSDLNKDGSADSGYSGITDGSGTYSASNTGSASTGSIFGEGLSLSGEQGSSSTFDTSSLGSSFGSASTGNFASGASGSGTGSSTFATGSTGTGSYGSSTGTFGSSYDGKGQSISVSTIDNGATVNGYDSSSGFTSASSTANTLTGYDASAISTSQGIPHETYGVPKFKVV